MRGRGRKRQRPSRGALDVRGMEGLGHDAEAARLAADLVEGEEADVAIEQRVFQALCHDRAGQLLEAAAETVYARCRGLAGPAGRHGAEQHGGDKLVHAAIRQGRGSLGMLQHLVDEYAILAGKLRRRDVGAVDWKGRNEVGERHPHGVDAVVTRQPVGVGDALDVGHEAFQLAGEAFQQHLLLRRDQRLFVAAGKARGVAIHPLEGRLGGGIDEDAVEEVQHLVAGGAGERPRAQHLARLQDLLGDDVEIRAHGALEVLGIGLGVRKPVDMVDAQALDQVAPHQIKDQFVNASENVGLLDAKAGEAVDIEEAAVVHVARGDPPVRGPVALLLQQAVKGAEAFRQAGRAIEDRDGAVDRLGDVGPPGQPGHAPFQRLARLDHVVTPMHRFLGESAQFLRDAQQAVDPVATLSRVDSDRAVEDVGICERAQRKTMLIVPDAEAARLLVEGELQIALFQHLAILRAQKRSHELAVSAEPLPVDVERVAERRQFAPFQDGQPPLVVRPTNAHVVGHDVQQQGQPLGLDGFGETLEPLDPAKFGVDGPRVDGVIAMCRAGSGFLDRRGIDVADAKTLEEGENRGGVREGEVLVELQPVCRGRRGRAGARRSRSRIAALASYRRRGLRERTTGGQDTF